MYIFITTTHEYVVKADSEVMAGLIILQCFGNSVLNGEYTVYNNGKVVNYQLPY